MFEPTHNLVPLKVRQITYDNYCNCDERQKIKESTTEDVSMAHLVFGVEIYWIMPFWLLQQQAGIIPIVVMLFCIAW